MRIGTYYYPDQWPKSQWERDFDNISALGLQAVHLGEFAWHMLEPHPGEYDLEWLSEVLALADERGLSVIMCTPTAAPPAWLIDQHPDILPMDDAGRRRRIGGRRHYSPLSPAYREASRRIVTELADRFGDHSTIIGWQIDNEYSGQFDQSEIAHEGFRQWLRDRYKTLEALNHAWGCQFWGASYSDFAQIELPPTRVPGYLTGTVGNPHQCLDASRFWSQAYAAFNRLQANILRPKIGKRFLTTNFMPFHPDCDPKDMAADLTLMSWDAYPVAGREINPSTEHYRIGDPYFMGLIHAQMASYTGRWGVMELQPGQINWSGVPARPYPGAMRLWLWTAFAHGAEFTMTYRFRQPRFGIELFHSGLVGTDGMTQTAGGREFSETIDELQRLEPSKVQSGQPDEFDPAKTVGLVFDFEQLWYFQILPQARRWNQPQWLRAWYAACARNGLNVKVLRPDAPWPAGLKMVIAPGLQMLDDALVWKLTDYARSGGHLVLTCRTGLMDRHGQLIEGLTAAPILPLIAGTIDAYDGLPEGKYGEVEMDGKKYKWGTWGDQLNAPASHTIAKYADQFYAGAAAVTQNRFGQGAVTYCGVCAEAPFIEALVEKIAPQAGLTLGKLPWRVQVLRRGQYYILLNYGDTPVDAPATKEARFVVGTRKTPPVGIAVWTEWPKKT